MEEPHDSSLEELQRRLGDPSLSPGRQALLAEQFRVSEALFRKRCERELALFNAIPVLCRKQEAFLTTGRRDQLTDCSLSDLAREANSPVEILATGLKGLCIRHRDKRTPLDELIGPVSSSHDPATVGFVNPVDLIPTDLPRNPKSFYSFHEIFSERRQNILDPVLVVEDPRRPDCALVCDGNHRTAAAFATSERVRIRVLRSKGDLARLQSGHVAAFADFLDFDEFVDKCREQSESEGLYQKGWDAYISGLHQR